MPGGGLPVTSDSLRIMVAHVRAHREQIAAGECGIPGALRPSLPLEPWQRDGVAYLMRTRRTRPTEKRRRAMAALLRDPHRANKVIAAETGGSDYVAWCARRVGRRRPDRRLPRTVARAARLAAGLAAAGGC